eukprot:1711766-Rhodomonas_salina.1
MESRVRRKLLGGALRLALSPEEKTRGLTLPAQRSPFTVGLWASCFTLWGLTAHGSRCRAQTSSLRVEGSGFKGSGLTGSGIRVQGSGFEVLRVHGLSVEGVEALSSPKLSLATRSAAVYGGNAVCVCVWAAAGGEDEG